ncbi:MAG: methyl-accepting chemotaxis protein [Clostridiales bacterium]
MNTLKSKLLIGVSVLIVFMLVISGVFIIQIRNMRSQFIVLTSNNLLENNIKDISEEMVEILTKLRVKYDEKYINSISEGAKELDSVLEKLDENIKYNKSIVVYKGLKHMTDNHKEIMFKAREAFKEKNLVEATKQYEEAIKNKSHIERETNKLISLELEYLKISQDELNKKITTIIIISIILMIILSGTILVIATIFSTRLTKNLTYIVKDAKKISDGNLKIDKREINSNDEIGELAGAFYAMVDSLKTIISEVGKNSNKVFEASDILNRNAEQSNLANDTICKAVEKTNDVAINQKDFVNTEVSKICNLIEEISTVGENVMKMTDKIEIAQNTMKTAKDNIQEIVSQVDYINEIMIEFKNKVDILNENSKQISKILNLIQNITKQTNLLSLNASIEAAKAGEFGESFKVVANEVRKFSAKSSDAGNEIKNTVKKMQDSVIVINDSINGGINEVTRSSKLVYSSIDHFKEIENSNLVVINGTKTIFKSIKDLSDKVNFLNDDFNSLSKLSVELTTQCEESSAVTEEQTASIDEIHISSIKLKEMATSLNKVIESFSL